jgi:hypothetical protein
VLLLGLCWLHACLPSVNVGMCSARLCEMAIADEVQELELLVDVDSLDKLLEFLASSFQGEWMSFVWSACS